MRTCAKMLTVSILFIASCMNLHGQDLRPAYGAFGDFALNEHRASFQALPGVANCCPTFSDGSGSGYAAGLSLVLPLSDVFSLVVRGSYIDHNAVLRTNEPFWVTIDGVATRARIEHSISSRLSSIGIEPLLGYRLWGGLRVHAGGRIGYVLQKTFSQKEVLTEPVGIGTFENGMRTRNELTDANIPRIAPVQGALVGGVSWSLPLNAAGSLFLVPEVMYSYGANSLVRGISWNADAVRMGLSILFSPLPAAIAVLPPVVETPPPPTRKPAIPPEQPILGATVSATGVYPDGREESVVRIKIEEFVSEQMKPLLNYVFFDEGESRLPERYRTLAKEKTGAFEIDALSKLETLDMYYHALNIIARRMQANPAAAIVLTGCNANTGAESGDLALSRRRAETVRDYLVGTWNIAPERVRIAVRNLPEKVSNVNDPDGVAENRRVEITSDSWELMAPVTTHERERMITPPMVRFRPAVTSTAGIKNWTLDVRQNTESLRLFADQDAPEKFIDWTITPLQAERMQSDAPLSYTLALSDRIGKNMVTPAGSLPVEIVTVEEKKREGKEDKEIKRYNLILFDFDSPTLTATNRRIADMIRGEVTPQAVVSITGYTDRIGDDGYNATLSLDRARSTAAAIGRPAATTAGMGEKVVLFTNDLPEGRFYSRTVEVVVEKKVR